MDFPKMSLKLLVDTKDERVLFAEANKDFVDFLFNIFSIPLGTLIGLLGSKQMVGCLGRLKDSIDSFDETYLQPDIIKDDIINPKTPFNGKMLLLSYDDTPATSKTVGRTCSTRTFSSDSNLEDSCDSEEEDYCDSKEEDSCDSAISWRLHNKNVKVARKRGYVKEVVSYMVMDDLVVKPMSTISSITLINSFGIKDLSQLEEKLVEFDKDKVMKLLENALKSTKVLTNVFLNKVDEGKKCNKRSRMECN